MLHFITSACQGTLKVTSLCTRPVKSLDLVFILTTFYTADMKYRGNIYVTMQQRKKTFNTFKYAFYERWIFEELKYKMCFS